MRKLITTVTKTKRDNENNTKTRNNEQSSLTRQHLNSLHYRMTKTGVMQ